MANIFWGVLELHSGDTSGRRVVAGSYSMLTIELRWRGRVLVSTEDVGVECRNLGVQRVSRAI